MIDQVYVLRVKLSWAKGVWREIAVLGSHTLADLHLAILDAFEWVDNDEPYRFYMSNDPDDMTALYASNDDWHNPNDNALRDFDLEEEQCFIYAFGETERHRFSLKVMIVDKPEKGATYPDIVDENGESPEQDLAMTDD